MFGGDIIRIATGHGLLTIDTDDPDVKIELLEAGKVIRIIDTKTEKQIDIKEGKYKLQAAGEDNSIEISPADLTMKRGGKEIVHVTHSPNPKSDNLPPKRAIPATNNQDSAGASAKSSNESVVADEFDPEQIAKLRAGFEEKLNSLSESIPVDQRQANPQWLDANLDLAEFELEAAVRDYEQGRPHREPRLIADLHAHIQQYYKLLKQRIRVEAANSPADGLPNESTLRLSTLKTRADIIQRQLWQFRSEHQLSTNEVKYSGKTLQQYITSARTERSDQSLFHAYTGISHLVDQFDSRQEFIDFVEESLKRLGKGQHFQSNESSGLENMLGELQGSELATMLLRFVTSSESSLQQIALNLANPATRPYADVSDSFQNQDDLYEKLLRSKSPAAKEFLARLTQQCFANDRLPESQAIRNKLTEIFRSEFRSTDNAEIRVEFAKALADLSPTASDLPEIIEMIFAESQETGFYLSEKIPADSANAKLMVPILTKLIDGKQEELTIDQNGGDSWEQAARILAGYGESIIDELDKHLAKSPRRLEVVGTMIDYRIRGGQAARNITIPSGAQRKYTVKVPVTEEQTVTVDGKETKKLVTTMKTETRTQSIGSWKQRIPIDRFGQESKLARLLKKYLPDHEGWRGGMMDGLLDVMDGQLRTDEDSNE